MVIKLTDVERLKIHIERLKKDQVGDEEDSLTYVYIRGIFNKIYFDDELSAKITIVMELERQEYKRMELELDE